MLIASAHLYGNGDEVRHKTAQVLAPSLNSFSATQSESAIRLIDQVARSVRPVNNGAMEIASVARKLLQKRGGEKQQWS